VGRPSRDTLIARTAAIAMVVALLAVVLPVTIRASATPSTVLAWGDNYFGEVGDGTRTERDAPVELAGLDSISDVAAGSEHSLALRSDGRVLAWGSNARGQLGDPARLGQVVTTPTLVPGLTDVVSIEAYTRTSLAVDRDGTVWQWGQAIQPGGIGVGPLLSAPTPVEGLPATSVSAGLGHRLAISYGTARPWGANAWGEQGDGSTWSEWRATPGRMLDQARAVAGGAGHTLVLREVGTVWSVGRNDNGQLGDGTITERHTPQAIPGLDGVVAIDAADFDSMALRDDGTLWSWGDSMGDVLGYPTAGDARSPRQIPGLTGVTRFDLGSVVAVAAITSEGVWTWGMGTGNPDRPISREPLLLPGTAGATDVARGLTHGLILLDGAPSAPPPVLPPPVATTLAVDAPAAAQPGEPVMFTATVSPSPGGGTVTLSTDGLEIARGPVDPATGVATLTAIFASERTYAILADFPAVSGFEGSSVAFELKVGRTPTTTTLVSASPSNPVERGSPVTIAVSVEPLPDQPAELDVLVDSQWVARVPVESDVTVITLDPLSPGSHVVTSRFIGNENYAPSESAPYSVVVSGEPTTTWLGATPAERALVGTPITFDVAVEPAGAAGTVEIVDGATTIGTIDLAAGHTLTTSELAAGIHSIHARFIPSEPEFEPSVSAALSYEVYLDTTAPTGTVAIVDEGGYSASLTVPLILSATDEGGAGLAFVDVSGDGATWERRPWPLIDAWSWTLATDASAPDGVYAVYARFGDTAGNLSAVVTDSTFLDRTSPELSGAVTSRITIGAQLTTSGAVPVTVQWPAGTDAGSGVAAYVVERSLDGGPWIEWRTLPAPLGGGAVQTEDLVGADSTRYRVRAIDVFGRGSATIAGSRMALSRYQETSPEVGTTGTWQSNTTAEAWGGTTSSTTDTGATMRLRFTGRGIYWIAPQGALRGRADVSIDGKLVGSVDLGRDGLDRTVVFGHTFAETGTHIIRIRCVGTPDHPLIEADGFVAARW
jgi:hypothetical protein